MVTKKSGMKVSLLFSPFVCVCVNGANREKLVNSSTLLAILQLWLRGQHSITGQQTHQTNRQQQRISIDILFTII